MEYSILGVTESSSIEDVNRALRRIRASYHPDKGDCSDAGRKLVELAEEAHRIILNRHRIDAAIGPLIDRSARDVFQGMQRLPFTMHPLFSRFPEAGQRVHESSYSYSNVNGEVRETGRVNGRPMNESEMRRFRTRERLQ